MERVGDQGYPGEVGGQLTEFGVPEEFPGAGGPARLDAARRGRRTKAEM